MNALHFLIKHNSIKKGLNLNDPRTSLIDIDDDDMKKLRLSTDVSEPLLMKGVGIMKNLYSEQNDMLKIKVCIKI